MLIRSPQIWIIFSGSNKTNCFLMQLLGQYLPPQCSLSLPQPHLGLCGPLSKKRMPLISVDGSLSIAIASPQQGNWSITDYMQYVKHNINSLALMNVHVDFDELSIRVLNGLGPAYSNISHALQVRETLVTFEELFEHLLNYEA